MATNKNSSELPWKRLASTWPGLTEELEIAQAARSLAGELAVASVQRFRIKLDPAAPWPTNIAPDHRWPAVALGFLSWASDCFDSVVLLTNAGLHVHARVLSRSLLEGLMNLLYISEKPLDRAQGFLSYYWAEQKMFFDRIAKISQKAGLPLDQTRCAAVNANYQLHCREHQDKKGNPKKSWHGKSRAELFQKISETTPGFEGWYEILYSPASNLAHVSTSAFVQYFGPASGTATLQLGLRSSEPEVGLMLKFATFAAIEIAGMANRALGVGLDQRLSELAKSLDALQKRAMASAQG